MAGLPSSIEKDSNTTEQRDALLHTRSPFEGGKRPNAPALRYSQRTLRLLAIYIPLLIVPWVITGVLVYHPIDKPTYIDQTGFTSKSLKLQDRLVVALGVLNSITSIVTVPIVSAVLAHAAVVYTQRRHDKQSVSARQVFALADRGWSNPGILKEAWPPWKTTPRGRSRGSGSAFLWLAALFLLFCGIQQPLREALVSTEQILVLTQAGARFNPVAFDKVIQKVGTDPEPDVLNEIPEGVVIQDLSNSLATFTRYGSPQNLWQDFESADPFYHRDIPVDGRFISPWSHGGRGGRGYFVAALPNGTTTGVRRHRAIRYNSTTFCEEITSTQFPEFCQGDLPFTSDFSRGGTRVRVCSPGRRGVPLMSISRDRQDIFEEIFVDMSMDGQNRSISIARHCNTTTTRGYFELGNARNSYNPGFLLNTWEEPDIYAVDSEFNDWLSSDWRIYDKNDGKDRFDPTRGWRRPSTEDKAADIPGGPGRTTLYNVTWPVTPGSKNSNLNISGPLMASAVAIFGERSLFALANSTENAEAALSQICTSMRIPFAGFSGYRQYAVPCNDTSQNSEQKLAGTIAQFMTTTFNETYVGADFLSAAVYFASESMLLQTARKTESYTGRPIYSAIGQYISKMSASLASLIVISIMIALQLLGLIWLAWYIYSVPTWTTFLDASAVARITNSLKPGVVPAIGPLDDQSLKRLDSADGLVGVVERVPTQEGLEGDPQDHSVELGLGAPGLFHRRLSKFQMISKKGNKYNKYDVDLDCNCQGCQRRKLELGYSTEETVH